MYNEGIMHMLSYVPCYGSIWIIKEDLWHQRHDNVSTCAPTLIPSTKESKFLYSCLLNTFLSV